MHSIAASSGGTPAPIFGLVLAGGQSTRMGRDKGLLDYHGIPQRQYLANLLNPFCTEVWVSLRTGQEPLPGERILPDLEPESGPLGGIRTAFAYNPGVAWLVVACDWPQISTETLQYLIENRRPEYLATAFRNSEDGTPEPLLTIWEPAIEPILQAAWEGGERRPRQLLSENHTFLIAAPLPGELQNINTPEAYRAWQGHGTAS